jgi:hypothetical protein
MHAPSLAHLAQFGDACKITFMTMPVWAGVFLDWLTKWPWGVIIGAVASVWVAYVSRDTKRKADQEKIHEYQTEIARLSANVAYLSSERPSKD